MRTFCRNGIWLTGIIVILISFAGCFDTETSSQGGNWFESAKEDLAGLPDDVISDSKKTFLKKNNATILLLAGGASIVMHNEGTDDAFNNETRRPQVFHGFSDEAFNVIGCPGTHFAAAGLWYAISVEKGDELNKDRAWTMIRALSLTGLATVGLKASRHNETPNGKDWAWPSGHTSSSFAVAAVLDEFYGPKVGIPAYAMAGLVGFRMMDSGDHWASDVLFGAALGWVVGHSVAGEHKRLKVAGFDVVPYVESYCNRSFSGIGFVKDF